MWKRGNGFGDFLHMLRYEKKKTAVNKQEYAALSRLYFGGGEKRT